MMPFKRVKPEELSVNPFTVIGKDWFLITAGTEKECNTMTASWGFLYRWSRSSGCTIIRRKAVCNRLYPPVPLHKRVCGQRGAVYLICI